MALLLAATAGRPAQSAGDFSRFVGIESWQCTWSIDLNLDTVEQEADASVQYRVGASVSGSCELPLENHAGPGADYFDWHIPDGKQPTLVDGRYHTYWKRTHSDGSYEGQSSDDTAFQTFGDDTPLLHLHLDTGTYDLSLPNATFETHDVLLHSMGDVPFDNLGVVSPDDYLDPGVSHTDDVPLPATGNVLEGTYSFDAFLGGFPRTVPCTVRYRFTPKEPERSVQVSKLEQRPKSKAAGATDFVFASRRLVLYAEATVTPPGKVSSVEWDVPEIAGSTRKVDDRKRDRKRGIAKLTVTYTGLPSSNGEFGAKTLRARLADGGEPRQDERSLRVFFDRDGTDNPGGAGEANWFYYWKQGAVPDLGQFTYSRGTKGAEYDPNSGTLRIGADATAAFGPLTLPLTTTLDGGHSFTLQRDHVEGVQAVAAAVRHELTHKALIERAKQASDADGDGIYLDQEADEAGYPPWTSYENPNTYGVTIDVFYGGDSAAWVHSVRGRARRARQSLVDSQVQQLQDAGDNEMKAIASEKKRTADEAQDWASPGSQTQAK
jgi:hypothetical protein